MRGVLLRAYIYMRMLGREGMSQVGEYATLNANYLLSRLKNAVLMRHTLPGGRVMSSSSRSNARPVNLM